MRRAGSRSRTPGPADGTSVAIIGAGRVGTALGLALRAVGATIEVVATKTPSGARRATNTFGPKTLALTAVQLSRLNPSQHKRCDRCSLVLITTPDDRIASVTKQLAAVFKSGPVRPRNRRGAAAHRVVLHTSGALSSDVLAPLRGSGFAIGSLHPLVSVSESRSGAELLTQAFFSVEGDPAAIRVGRSIVRELGGQSFTIDSHRKALYHAAAVIVSPHMTALFDIAVEMLVRCGLSATRARHILLPLVQSTLANLTIQAPAQALTGTFKRGDISTVEKHLTAIDNANLPDALAAYIGLGQRSISIAKRHNTDPAELDRITSILARAAKKSGPR